jgi:hypothetical protein
MPLTPDPGEQEEPMQLGILAVGIAFHAVEGCPLVGQPKLPQLTIEFR